MHINAQYSNQYQTYIVTGFSIFCAYFFFIIIKCLINFIYALPFFLKKKSQKKFVRLGTDSNWATPWEFQGPHESLSEIILVVFLIKIIISAHFIYSVFYCYYWFQSLTHCRIHLDFLLGVLKLTWQNSSIALVQHLERKTLGVGKKKLLGARDPMVIMWRI